MEIKMVGIVELPGAKITKPQGVKMKDPSYRTSVEPARKVITLSNETFKSWVFATPFEFCQKGKRTDWRKMPDIEKVKWHFKQIAEREGGTLKEAFIFD